MLRAWLVAVLVAVTVTPGRTAPDSSVTVPSRSAAVRRACANNPIGMNRSSRTMRTRAVDAICIPPCVFDICRQFVDDQRCDALPMEGRIAEGRLRGLGSLVVELQSMLPGEADAA